MLATRLTDLTRLTDPAYVAEPKLDGQRAQVHVVRGCTVACYSRPGRELLTHPGFAWLKGIAWPVDAAVFDGEACAGDGHEGVQAVFTERHRPGGDLAFCAFDILELGGRLVMREPWRDRRKRLEDILDGRTLPRVGVVPVTDDPPRLYETWIAMGGEGIVLKERGSIYRPGIRTPAWFKLKPKLTLDVVVTDGSGARIAWGDWGEATVLELRYAHPRTGAEVAIRQAVRIPRSAQFQLTIGARADIVCWGVMPSGMLRHPLFLGWKGSSQP
jgi:ATP-dependent DNA ligase